MEKFDFPKPIIHSQTIQFSVAMSLRMLHVFAQRAKKSWLCTVLLREQHKQPCEIRTQTKQIYVFKLLADDQWWPFFVTILFCITDVIVLSNSIFWLNKQDVTVGIKLNYILK